MKAILTTIKYFITVILYVVSGVSFLLVIDPEDISPYAGDPAVLAVAILSFMAAVFIMCYKRK